MNKNGIRLTNSKVDELYALYPALRSYRIREKWHLQNSNTRKRKRKIRDQVHAWISEMVRKFSQVYRRTLAVVNVKHFTLSPKFKNKLRKLIFKLNPARNKINKLRNEDISRRLRHQYSAGGR